MTPNAGAPGGRPLVLRGGRVLDPASGTDAVLDVLLKDGEVAAVGPDLASPDRDVLDVAGLWVVPGLVDLHVHLREPGREDEETVASGASAAVAGGFTSICCMPNTDPPLDTAGAVRYVLDRAAAAGGARVHPIGAITRGLEGKDLTEMADLRDAGAVALSDDGRMVMDPLLMRRAMEYARGLGAPLTLHSLDERLAHGGWMHEGRVSTVLGLAGSPAVAEVAAVARDVALAEATGARVHIAHVSTRGAVEILRAARAKGLRVSGEATPHHLALTDEAVYGYDTRFKINPPLRPREDVEALREAVADGTIEAIATDHAPHAALEKDLPFDEAPFGTTGLETAVPVTYTVLVETGLLTPLRWVERLSWGPARIFGLPAGRLAPGVAADVTVLDPRLEREVRAEAMRSLSKNSCFLGDTYRCWPVHVFVGGRRFDV